MDGPAVLGALAGAGIPRDVCGAVLAAVRSLLKHAAEGDYGRIAAAASGPADDAEAIQKLAQQLGLPRAACVAICQAAVCVRNGQRAEKGARLLLVHPIFHGNIDTY